MRPPIIALACGLPALAMAGDDRLALDAPQVLDEAGFLQYLLPRFSLKHGIRVDRTATPPEATLGDTGTPVFVGLGRTWRLIHDDSAKAATFAAWITSDIGANTVAAFPGGGFAPPADTPEAVAPVTPDGDPAEGARLSQLHCGRCHVVSDANRMAGIGATPSFAVLRALPGWENRFATFYVLNPHPSFTTITDLVTPDRPAAIAPVELSVGDVEAIAAYAATLDPADLGAPIQAK